MLKTQRLTREFMEKCELQISDKPTSDITYVKLMNLVTEEYEEFIRSMEWLRGTPQSAEPRTLHEIQCKVIDAMCDLIVVIHNTSNAMGIDLELFFDEVHKKNMEKQGGPKRDDGKQLKPEGWTPPDHESILKRIIGVEIDKQYNLCPEQSSDFNGPTQFVCEYCETKVPAYTEKRLFNRLICSSCLHMYEFGGAPRLIPTKDKSLERDRTSFVKRANCKLEKLRVEHEMQTCTFPAKSDKAKPGEFIAPFIAPLPKPSVVITEEPSIFEKLAEATGKLVTEKNAAYGDSVRTSGKIMQLLYPNGIAFDQIPAALLTVRVLDKLSRIANDPSYGGEDPAQDITGYGLLLQELVKNGL